MLAKSDSIKLRDLEGIIERGLQTFVEVGAALRLIREGRLYRTDFGTFEEYCQERWDWSRVRSHQLIEASGLATEMLTIVNTPVANEGQARELAKVPAEQRAEVWETVVQESPQPQTITAKKVAEVRDRVVVGTDNAPQEFPWGAEDKWCWKLKNLYNQAPKRSQNHFKKWVST